MLSVPRVCAREPRLSGHCVGLYDVMFLRIQRMHSFQPRCIGSLTLRKPVIWVSLQVVPFRNALFHFVKIIRAALRLSHREARLLGPIDPLRPLDLPLAAQHVSRTKVSGLHHKRVRSYEK